MIGFNFQNEGTKFVPFSRTDIEVTGEQIASGLITAPLQVRRGSEPALNQLVPAAGSTTTSSVINGSNCGSGPSVPSTVPDLSKRWSATPIIVDDDNIHERRTSHHRKVSLYHLN